MDESRFFLIVDADAYEAARLALDASRQMPHGETTFEPLETAPKATSGVLLAIRRIHCDLPDIAAAIGQMLSASKATEITREQYFAAIITPAE